jgi:hypothetical protein
VRALKKGWMLRLVLPLGLYLLVEWLFAYVTLTDGLVTPHGTPHPGVIALGVLYLGLRLGMRLLFPAAAVVVLARKVPWLTGGKL